jgi:hypothetical protein
MSSIPLRGGPAPGRSYDNSAAFRLSWELMEVPSFFQEENKPLRSSNTAPLSEDYPPAQSTASSIGYSKRGRRPEQLGLVDHHHPWPFLVGFHFEPA